MEDIGKKGNNEIKTKEFIIERTSLFLVHKAS